MKMKSSGGDKKTGTRGTKEEREVGKSRRESKKKRELKDEGFGLKGRVKRSKQKVERLEIPFREISMNKKRERSKQERFRCF